MVPILHWLPHTACVARALLTKPSQAGRAGRVTPPYFHICRALSQARLSSETHVALLTLQRHCRKCVLSKPLRGKLTSHPGPCTCCAPTSLVINTELSLLPPPRHARAHTHTHTHTHTHPYDLPLGKEQASRSANPSPC